MEDATVGEDAASRNLVEEFYQLASSHLTNECVVVSFVPWAFATPPPPAVLFPQPASGLLDEDELQRRAGSRKIVVAGSTFMDEAGEDPAVRLILSQFKALSEDTCILMAHLLPEMALETPEDMDFIMLRHKRMLSLGFCDVLMNPPLDPTSLYQAVTISYQSWHMNMQRLRVRMQAPTQCGAEAEGMEQLMNQYQQLMFDDIPRNLMPHFKLQDPELVETDRKVGDYRLVNKMKTAVGTVMEGLDANHSRVAIKVLNKYTMLTPGELEGIYREQRFLTELLDHPNIIKCLDMLHSANNIYMIFEYGGASNLQQALVSHPGQRFEAATAWDCFTQILSGLEYCHKKHVAHRNMSLSHVVLSQCRTQHSLPTEGDELRNSGGYGKSSQGTAGDSSNSQAPRDSSDYLCKLIDFHCAVLGAGDFQSRSSCGTFPYMAPEVAVEESYNSQKADCWSLGVILLEMAGGLGSLTSFTGAEASQDPDLATALIRERFSEPGCHQQALCGFGASPSMEIVQAEQELLRPLPETRPDLSDMVASLKL